MNKKAMMGMLIALAVIIALFAILYFINQDLVFIMYALLAIGVLNIVNGFVAMKSGVKTVGMIFFIGGAALTVFMLLAIFVLR